MSVQFGRWNIDGLPVDQDYLAMAGEMLAPYGPDGGGTYIKDSVRILYRTFHTTKESRKETQPFVTPSGAVLCWDGRLDNREELVRELRDVVTISATDLAMVVAAHQAWGVKCFAKLIGDWALSIWDPRNRSLLLAKDPIGTRHIYYSFDQKQINWSTVLDPLVLLAGKTFALEEEYIAGWLSFFPATHLTPYAGIHSVLPSCFVRLEPGRQTTSRYWDFDPSKRISYRTDGEYEEHFRHVFGESVRRRLRSNSPVLAELSGGMDSSSIVCIADTILAQGRGETPRLDTLSYYNDAEPNWNEKPYFNKVEKKRGRSGCHIDVSIQETLKFDFECEVFPATPGSGGVRSNPAKQFAACMISQGNRVVLSGIGGDEVAGGVPTPVPELMDLIVMARFKHLAHELRCWALNKRRPWFHLLFEAMCGFLSPALTKVPKHIRPAPWLHPSFVRRRRAVLTGYPSRVKWFGPLPSFQENISTLNTLRRQLACFTLPADPPHERRYPYLDRELLEFLYAIPRDQLVRPGQRRSLMRRSLVDIVPNELLSRKRKAYVVRAPLASIATDWSNFAQISQDMVSSSLGIIVAGRFLEALRKARNGRETPMITLARTLAVERWLRDVARSWSSRNDGITEYERPRVRPGGERERSESLK